MVLNSHYNFLQIYNIYLIFISKKSEITPTAYIFYQINALFNQIVIYN